MFTFRSGFELVTDDRFVAESVALESGELIVAGDPPVKVLEMVTFRITAAGSSTPSVPNTCNLIA